MLRIPQDISTKAKGLAKKRHVSYNTYVIQAIEEKNKAEKLKEER